MDDLRFAWRMLRKSPGFSLFAILTLTIGIGANSAIFTVIDSVILRPLPYPRAEELVSITNTVREGTAGMSLLELNDLRQQATVLSSSAGVLQFPGNLTGGDLPARIEALGVTANYFQVLGIGAALGRTFVPADETPGITQIAVISDSLWRRRFGGDPGVLGKSIELDDDPYTVVGVMPPQFAHPAPAGTVSIEVWVPCGFRGLPFTEPKRTDRFLGVFARLAPRKSLGDGETQLQAIADRLHASYPADYPAVEHWGLRVRPLAQLVLGDAARGLLLLFAAVGLVLLIACSNVAVLLMSRAAARRQELTVRAALGASRLRLIRQLLVESLLLSLIGGALGVVLALWATDLLVAVSPAALPRAHEIKIDLAVLAFTVGLSCVSAVLFGLLPAVRASRTDLQSVLNEGGRSLGAPGHRLRTALVIAEIALAMIMLVGSGLLMRSLSNALNTSPGFDPQRTVAVEIWLPLPNDRKARYSIAENRAGFIEELLRRVRALPGVSSAGLTTSVPLTKRGLAFASANQPFAVEGRDEPGGRFSIATDVSEGYFETMRIALRAGRTFTPADRLKAPLVMAINESMAARVWPKGDALGARVHLGRAGQAETTFTVVGVVADVKTVGLDQEVVDELYVAQAQRPAPNLSLLVRLGPGAERVAQQLPEVVRGIDRNLPVSEVRPLEQLVLGAVAQRRFVALLLALFAGAALAMAALGIYSVTSYSVTQRHHEIGVRLAVGASGGDVLRLLLGQALRVACAGVALGTFGAFVAARSISRLLFGVGATDPPTFALLALVLAGVALFASWVPARRAARVDPVVALRSEV